MKAKLKRQRIPGLSSAIIHNADLNPEQLLMIGRNPFKERGIATIFVSIYKGKEFLLGIVGATYPQPDTAELTALGSVVMEVLQDFEGFADQVSMVPITCGHDPIPGLIDVFEAIEDRAVVALIGDFAGTCDGKVIPYLGLTDVPRYIQRKGEA